MQQFRFGKDEVNLQKAQTLVPNKKAFYKAMIRNQYFVPQYKSSLCCVKWMQRVRTGKYHCPKVQDLRPMNCADPPLKEEILEHLLGYAKDKGLNMGISMKRMPDKHWALQVLHSFKPDHKFFKKDYLPKKMVDKIMIDNSDGFFDNLPPGQFKKRIGGVFKEPEENRLKRQLAIHETRMKNSKRKLLKLANKKDSDDDDKVVDDSESEDEKESDEFINSSSQIMNQTSQDSYRTPPK